MICCAGMNASQQMGNVPNFVKLKYKFAKKRNL